MSQSALTKFYTLRTNVSNAAIFSENSYVHKTSYVKSVKENGLLSSLMKTHLQKTQKKQNKYAMMRDYKKR